MLRILAAWLVASLSLVFVLDATADEGVDNPSDRFELWNRCEPMPLHVHLNEEAVAIGMTEEAVMIAVRSRLRAARLYLPEPELFDWENVSKGMPLEEFMQRLEYEASGLHVYIWIARSTFSQSVEYRKRVTDEASEVRSFVATWADGSFGTHGRDPGFILQSISETTDRFIDEYLRVNDLAC